jgi:hypothetical protein
MVSDSVSVEVVVGTVEVDVVVVSEVVVWRVVVDDGKIFS